MPCYSLTGRFHHAPWTSIRRDNVLEWLAWSCFKIQYDHCKADLDRVAALEDIMDMLEARTGTVFEQGYNSEIRSMRLTLDPVNVRADHWQSGIRQHPGKSPPIHDLRSNQRCQLVPPPLCLRFIWHDFRE